jgi:hypothetical protein
MFGLGLRWLTSFNARISLDLVFSLSLLFLHQLPLYAEQSVYPLAEHFNFIFSVHEASPEGS